MTQPDPTDQTAATHERSGPPVLGDVHSFPSYAELTRTLVDGGTVASIATLTNDGFPYTSMAPISVDRHGAPIICVSELAEHTRNLRRSARASVLVVARSTGAVDPLSEPRATYVGSFVAIEPDQATVERHLDAHPSTGAYLEFGDFGWWRLRVQHLRYVGGFGVMGWSSADELAHAEPDPVIPVSGPMIDHLNDDHADALTLMAQHAAPGRAIADATATDLDRHGLTLLASGPFPGSGHAVVRVAFPVPLDRPDEVRAAVVDLVRTARSIPTPH